MVLVLYAILPMDKVDGSLRVGRYLRLVMVSQHMASIGLRLEQMIPYIYPPMQDKLGQLIILVQYLLLVLESPRMDHYRLPWEP